MDTHKGIPVFVVESKPTNPCKVCLGQGKVVCGTCDGKGTIPVCTAASVSAASQQGIKAPGHARSYICEIVSAVVTKHWHLYNVGLYMLPKGS